MNEQFTNKIIIINFSVLSYLRVIIHIKTKIIKNLFFYYFINIYFVFRNFIFNKKEERYQTDGLNSLQYHVLKYELKPLFTWILVSVNETEIMKNN